MPIEKNDCIGLGDHNDCLNEYSTFHPVLFRPVDSDRGLDIGCK
jgi:hypothetical protein